MELGLPGEGSRKWGGSENARQRRHRRGLRLTGGRRKEGLCEGVGGDGCRVG